MIKYVLWAGWVLTEDGDMHLVTAGELAKLYGLPMGLCYAIPASMKPDMQARLAREFDERQPDLIHLFPRIDGDYTLP